MPVAPGRRQALQRRPPRPRTREATSLSSSASQPRARLWFLGGAGPRLWTRASVALPTLKELCRLTLAEDVTIYC